MAFSSATPAVMAAEDHRFLGDLLRREGGRALSSVGDAVLARRLAAVALTLGFASTAALMTRLRHQAPAPVVKSVCDALSGGAHSFFRDPAGFAAIRTTLLPRAAAIASEEGRAVRIWSAACATGQEAYSVAMIVADETERIGAVPVEIVASDYSAPIVARAEAGVFTAFDVQRGLPSRLLVRHFTSHGDDYRVSDALRARVNFVEQNLLGGLTVEGAFDIILMRHVLMYFDTATRRDVAARVAARLTPHGALVLGDNENLRGASDSLRRDLSCRARVYTPASTAVDAGFGAPAGAVL